MATGWKPITRIWQGMHAGQAVPSGKTLLIRFPGSFHSERSLFQPIDPNRCDSLSTLFRGDPVGAASRLERIQFERAGGDPPPAIRTLWKRPVKETLLKSILIISAVRPMLRINNARLHSWRGDYFSPFSRRHSASAQVAERRPPATVLSR